MENDVYLSIALFKVTREQAEEIIRAVMDLAPGVDVSVHFSAPIDNDDEETQDDDKEATEGNL